MVEEVKTEEKKNKNIKPAWLPWLIIGVELVVVLGIGTLSCLTAIA